MEDGGWRMEDEAEPYFIVLPLSRGMIARSSRRISSRRLRRSFVISSPSTGFAPLYQLMLSRTSPSAYSNLSARSLPELREYASAMLASMPHIDAYSCGAISTVTIGLEFCCVVERILNQT